MRAILAKPINIDANGHQVVDAFIVSDTTPLPLPMTGANVDGMSANDVFAPFSILYIVNDADTKLFIADESGAFIAQ